jgi:hypothetical protein
MSFVVILTASHVGMLGFAVGALVRRETLLKLGAAWS